MKKLIDIIQYIAFSILIIISIYVFSLQRSEISKLHANIDTLKAKNTRLIESVIYADTIFSLVPKNDRFGEVKYRADFTYYDKHGNYVVEDVKPYNKRTGKFLLTPVYELKKKLMYHFKKIIIKEY